MGGTLDRILIIDHTSRRAILKIGRGMACFPLALAPGLGWAGGTEEAAVVAWKVSQRTRGWSRAVRYKRTGGMRDVAKSWPPRAGAVSGEQGARLVWLRTRAGDAGSSRQGRF